MFHDRFDGNTPQRTQLQVCQISDKELCEVEFRDTPDTTRNSYLLSALNLIFSSPSIDHQVGHLFKLLIDMD